MQISELLAQSVAAGLVARAESGRLVITGPKSAEPLVKQLLARKEEVLATLPTPTPHAVRPPRAPSPALPPWDQPEADRLLSHLRTELARIEQRQYAGHFPPLLARSMALRLSCVEAIARDHEKEAANGWDALALIRGAIPNILSVARAEPWKGQLAPWQR